MSSKAVFWALALRDLNPTERVVLIYLADAANEDGYCWPGKATIASRTGIKSTRTVDTAIDRLERRNLISIQRRQKEGRNLSNYYFLNLDQGDLFNSNPANIAVPQKLQGCKKDEKVGQKMREGGAKTAPESLKESNKESFKGDQKNPDQNQSSGSAPWYLTNQGIWDKIEELGILIQGTPPFDEILDTLIQKLDTLPEGVPVDLIAWRDRLRATA